MQKNTNTRPPGPLHVHIIDCEKYVDSTYKKPSAWCKCYAQTQVHCPLDSGHTRKGLQIVLHDDILDEKRDGMWDWVWVGLDVEEFGVMECCKDRAGMSSRFGIFKSFKKGGKADRRSDVDP